jgi:subtilisin family serine protease
LGAYAEPMMPNERSGSIPLPSRALLLLPILAVALVACPPAPEIPVGIFIAGDGNTPSSQTSSASPVTTQGVGTPLIEVGQRVRYAANGAAGFKWSLNPSGDAYGMLDQAGLYVAPSSVPTPALVTIRACDSNNPSDCGEAKLTVVAAGAAPGINGTLSIPTGLIANSTNNPLGFQALSAQVAPQAKPFKADWSLPHAPGQVLVVGSSQSLSGKGIRMQSVGPGVSKVSVPNGESEAAFAAKLEAQGAVVQPNYLYRVLDAPSPNDTLYGTKQFNLTQIDAPGAWNVTTNSARIAVIDTGADFTHPDLQGRLVKGKDFCPTFNSTSQVCSGEDDDPSEGPSNLGTGNSGHGTHTTGIIAAVSNNGTGVTGLTWGGKVLVIKVFDGQGEFTDSATLAKAIEYAADPTRGAAKVINLSLGLPNPDLTTNPDKLIANAIVYADSRDVLVVAAAGNHQPSVPNANKKLFYPASDPLVVPVGAVDPFNAISGISARGSSKLIMAPGQGSSFTPLGEAGIWSTKSGGGYEARYGTSEAAPQVAAVAGLIRSQNTGLSALQTRGILQTTARNLGDSATFGFGLLQAGAALRKAGNPNTTPATKTTVYVYADRFVNGKYDGNDLKTGRTELILNGTSGSIAYKITLTRDGSSLPAGTYRVVACVNKNSNGIACDSGDLAGVQENVQYAGSGTIGADVTLAQK